MIPPVILAKKITQGDKRNMKPVGIAAYTSNVASPITVSILYNIDYNSIEKHWVKLKE